MTLFYSFFFFFFFNDTATTEIYTLSLHDALPICGFPPCRGCTFSSAPGTASQVTGARGRSCRRSSSMVSRAPARDRKSTRLNSSHDQISYAVFCLKKKKKDVHTPHLTIPPPP